MKGDAGVVSRFSNKIQAAMAHLVPAGMLADQHWTMAEPGTHRS